MSESAASHEPKRRRHFAHTFKVRLLREIAAGRSLVDVAREYQIHPGLLSRWRHSYGQFLETHLRDSDLSGDSRIAELERMIGQLTVENSMLRRSLNELQQSRTSERRDESNEK